MVARVSSRPFPPPKTKREDSPSQRDLEKEKEKGTTYKPTRQQKTNPDDSIISTTDHRAAKYHADPFGLETPPPVKPQTTVSTHSTGPLGLASGTMLACATTPVFSCKSEGRQDKREARVVNGEGGGGGWGHGGGCAPFFIFLRNLRTLTTPLEPQNPSLY